jgi:hypothetical protein
LAIERVALAIPHLEQELPELARLNRFRWVTGIVFQSYGLRVGIRTNDAEVLALLPSRLPPDRKPYHHNGVDRLYSLKAAKSSHPDPGRLFIYANQTRLTRLQNANVVVDALERDLQAFLAEHARNRLFVHAGVVGYAGRAILIPGRSFKGKSTLVREFVRAGATYYSDEYAVLDLQGRVHPYPRLLALREGPSGSIIRVSADAIGGRTGSRPLQVGLVLVCTFRAGARWRPRPLSTGQAAMALVANTVAARQRPADMLDIFQKVLASAQSWQGVRGEAVHMVKSVLAELVPAH